MKSEKIKALSTTSKQFRVISQANRMLLKYKRLDALRLALLLLLIILALGVLSGISYYIFCSFLILVNALVFYDAIDDSLDFDREKILEIMNEP